MVQSLMDAGVLTPKEAASSPYRNVILQALGARDEIEPSLVEIELEPDDCLVFCTDGLSNKISGDEIREALNGPGTLYDACSKMVELAKERGGEDNITVIAVRF
jgi:protein phosphatase